MIQLAPGGGSPGGPLSPPAAPTGPLPPLQLRHIPAELGITLGPPGAQAPVQWPVDRSRFHTSPGGAAASSGLGAGPFVPQRPEGPWKEVEAVMQKYLRAPEDGTRPPIGEHLAGQLPVHLLPQNALTSPSEEVQVFRKVRPRKHRSSKRRAKSQTWQKQVERRFPRLAEDEHEDDVSEDIQEDSATPLSMDIQTPRTETRLGKISAHAFTAGCRGIQTVFEAMKKRLDGPSTPRKPRTIEDIMRLSQESILERSLYNRHAFSTN